MGLQAMLRKMIIIVSTMLHSASTAYITQYREHHAAQRFHSLYHTMTKGSVGHSETSKCPPVKIGMECDGTGGPAPTVAYCSSEMSCDWR